MDGQITDDWQLVSQWLASGAAFGDEVPERIDTHGASIFLTQDRAWKIKRPVQFSYMDFSTAERRHAMLDAELRLNRRTAPDLYLALRAITRGADGKFALDGGGEPVDWVLEMRRFPDDALLARYVAQHPLDSMQWSGMADRLVAFHESAEILPGDAGAARIGAVITGNLASMLAFPEILDPARANALVDAQRQLVDRHAALLDERARAGRIRHGHGDLHLGNLAMIDGVPIAFDCLEFDPELAITDVLYDLAFLLMDLWDRGMRQEANLVCNRYLDLSYQDASAMMLLPLFMSVRATVRAHVLAAQAAAGLAGAYEHAQRYLALALMLTQDVPAWLVAVGGLSGTGKSTLARVIGGDIGIAPGARILRSDVLRKRLAGVSPETHLPADSYTPEMSSKVYGALEAAAAAVIASGHAVIADAVFGNRAERRNIADVAVVANVPFQGVWLELPEDERVRRIEARGADASDADAAVARVQTHLLRSAEPDEPWLHLNASRPLADNGRMVADALQRRAAVAVGDTKV